MGKIRTRFAPSPTGFLHIGGIRTALFSFLFARHNNGDFILRIEDTDRSRFVQGAVEDIIASLKWLGISWDEGPDIGGKHGPYRQSERKDIYRSMAFELIKQGRAYKCFCTRERLKALRENQNKPGKSTGYDKHCRKLTADEIAGHEKTGDPFVVRLKIPGAGQTAFDDAIRGKITTPNDIIDDTILLKSDGLPTYHLANVADDHLMEITHVIRGEEWISSTPIHVILYNAFEWSQPVFSHVPVILAEGGGKLSKRHGATMVSEFKQRGYLSEAFLNYIALLGWSLDDKTEFFDMDKLIKYFNLQRVNKAAAVFSYEKLDWFNGIYIRKKREQELYNLLLPFIIREGLLKEEESSKYKEYILKIVPLIQERLKYLSDVSRLIWFFFDDHFEVKERQYLIPKKLQKKDAVNILEQAIKRIKSVTPFQIEEVEAAMRDLVLYLQLKAGQVFMTIRIAITGTRVSPGLFETICVMGQDRVIKRLYEAVKILRHME